MEQFAGDLGVGGLVTQDTSFVSPICYLMMGRKNSGLSSLLGFPGGSDSKKKSACNTKDLGLIPGLGRSLVGYSPWGHKESDTTERLTHTSSLLVHAQLSHPFTPL